MDAKTITMPNGDVINIKDDQARQDISTLNSKIDGLIKTKSYAVTPDSNSSVSPFSYYKEIAIDVTYTTILGVNIVGGGSTNPSVVKLNSTGTTIWYYSAKNSAVTVELVYI